MTVQTLKIGRREFVLLPKRDFDRLTAQARRQAEDDYWADSALKAEANARAKGEKPIPFEDIERELDSRRRTRRTSSRRRRS